MINSFLQRLNTCNTECLIMLNDKNLALRTCKYCKHVVNCIISVYKSVLIVQGFVLHNIKSVNLSSYVNAIIKTKNYPSNSSNYKHKSTIYAGMSYYLDFIDKT